MDAAEEKRAYDREAARRHRARLRADPAAYAAYLARARASESKNRPRRVVLLTECSMSDNVAIQYPELEFIRPCNLCPHMKKITLRNIRRALETMQHDVYIRPEIAVPARRAVERMLAVH